MPASYTETVNPIEESLKESLGNKDTLDRQLEANSFKILMQDIEFEQAQKSSTFQLENIRQKYVALTSQHNLKNEHILRNGNDMKMNLGNSVDQIVAHDGIPVPKVDLFPADKISQSWSCVRKVGSGLQNMGNTCFLNSTLQCLTYTAPLVSYLETDDHPLKCKIVGFCMVCELQRHIKRCFENGGQTIRPHSILVKLKLIAKHMHWGRQEDAHEFLRYLVDAMQKACLNGNNKLDKYSKETTVINRIFGGFLRSQVQCLRCKERSNTYDPFQDINLDIKSVPNIQKAFEKFVQPETLDCDNAYNCPRCKHKGSATKRFTLHRPSNILTIQLKRFDYNRFFGGKISRHISFTEKLDIRPYMSHKQGEPVLYHLYAVLVHSGSSCNSGHYYCYIKAPNQAWYCMNDSNVAPVSLQRVLSSEAYMLFYMKATQISLSINNNNNNHVKLKAVNRPSFAHKSKPAALGCNKTSNGFFDNDLGRPVEQIVGPHLPTPQPSTCMIATPGKRDKISFGINSVQKPRIVLNIKKNSSGYTVENGKPAFKKKSPLVPYDLDSDQENKSSPCSSDEPEIKDSNLGKTPLDELSKSQNVKPSNKHCNVNKESCKTDSYGNIFTNLTKPEKRDMMLPKSKVVKQTFSEPYAAAHTLSVKRPCGDQQLTCVTSQPKVNATTPWHILHKDCQVSPSIGSDVSNVSNNSANSTSEWKVEDNIENQRICSNDTSRLTAGWIVTPNDLINRAKSKKLKPCRLKRNNAGVQCNHENVNRRKSSLNTSVDAESCRQPTNEQLLVEEPFLDKNAEQLNSDSKYGCHISEKEDGLDDVYDTEWVVKLSPRLIEKNFTEPVDEDECPKSKKHKKHKRKRGDNDINEGSDGEECLSRRKHKKKKRKHKHKRKHHHEDGEVMSDQTEESTEHEGFDNSSAKKDVRKIYDWVEKTKEKIVKKEYSNKRGAEEDMNQYRALAEVKKFMTKPPQPRSLLPKIMHKSKREKPKEKIDSDAKYLNHPEVEQESELLKAEREDGEVEMETMIETKIPSEVPSTCWDHHVKDGFTSRQHHDKTNHSYAKTSWDGSHSSNVIEELQKQTLHGYGSSVNSWTGGKNNIDNEVFAERARENKRTWSDDYDDEVDRGRTKKNRKESLPRRSENYGYKSGNPFQRYHENRNRNKQWSSHRDYTRNGGNYRISSYSYQQHANGRSQHQQDNHGRY
ncbi:uncharacterized protein LOC141903569 [Tubulanus polymorphus]|uniref:uncharacterized protein LOC141903569 n=1 Tax=Tubulanus polymorphus TaxID=672921 RepID=UPI003DA551DC